MKIVQDMPDHIYKYIYTPILFLSGCAIVSVILGPGIKIPTPIGVNIITLPKTYIHYFAWLGFVISLSGIAAALSKTTEAIGEINTNAAPQNLPPLTSTKEFPWYKEGQDTGPAKWELPNTTLFCSIVIFFSIYWVTPILGIITIFFVYLY